MKRQLALLLGVLLLAVAAAGCGAQSSSGGADPEERWLALLSERGLQPAKDALTIGVAGEAPLLSVTITLPSDRSSEAYFPDGLYGAEAFSFDGDRWRRVDTAEIRTEIAPILGPGQSATVELPVEEADGYRVLVPLEGSASWADL